MSELTPGSDRTIYLDFEGQTVSGTAWNAAPPNGSGVPAGGHPAYDPAGDGDAFSSSEREQVQDIWQRVAEDYAPFDVDVTTQDPGAAAMLRSGPADGVYGTRALITPSTSAAAFICSSQCGGVAYLDVFSDDQYSPAYSGYYQPAWVFPQLLGNDAKNIAEAASHEVGHNLSLEHDGTSTLGYYNGVNSDNWAPIMGAAYDQPISQWSKGDYTDANNTAGSGGQDDVALISLSRNLPFRADEAGDTTASAASTLPTGSAYVHNRGDVDVYALGTCSGTVTLNANTAPVSPNLDIRLQLLGSTGGVVATADPPSTRVDFDVATGMNASISQSVTAGTYFLAVDGVGKGSPTTSYDDYGSLGAYTLAATGCSQPPGNPVAPGAPTGLAASANGSSSAITVTWSAPADDGGSPVTGYTVTRNGAAPVSVGASTFQHSFTGLDPSTTYAFTVTATNVGGTGPAASVSASTAPAPPADTAAPVLAAYDFTPKAVELSSGAKEVVVTAGLTDATGVQPPTMVISSDSTTQTAGSGPMSLVSGTIQDGTWQRSVTIPTTAAPGSWTVSIQPLSDTVGNNDGTLHSHPTKLSVTNTPPATAPAAPTGVSATRGNASAVVTWTAPAANGSPITGYTVTSSPGGVTKAVTGTATSATVLGLTNGTAYTFTVTATNAVGTGPASAPSAAVTPATKPGRVAVPTVKVTGHKAVIRWVARFNGGSPLTGFRVDVNGKVRTTGADVRKLVLTLKPGRYEVRVAARNALGVGPRSGIAKFRIRA